MKTKSYIEERLEAALPKKGVNMEQNFDVVNKPKHYNRENAMQCIEEMELVFGVEAVKHFCLCNAWKYRYRAADKNGTEDIAKSDWYLNKYKELCKNSITCSNDYGYNVVTKLLANDSLGYTE